MPKLQQFAEGVGAGFEQTIIPVFLATAFAYVIPFVEMAVGILLILDWFTRMGLIIAGFLMVVLISGMVLQEQWSTVGTQMIYLVVIYLLLKHEKDNSYCLNNTL